MNSTSSEIVYITRYNSYKILNSYPTIEELGLDVNDLPGKVSSIVRGKKTILSEAENRWLLCAKVMYKNFDIYVDKIYNKYEHIKPKKYILEISVPKYHTNCFCDKLKSDLENPYLIPKEIKKLNENKQDIFCGWFLKNQKRFEKNPISYIEEAFNKFGIKFISLPAKDLTQNNSGTKHIFNSSKDELIIHINHLIDEGLNFYEKDTYTRKIIDCYGDNYINRNLVSREQFNILTNWHSKKTQLKEGVLNYFQLRFNPSLEFDKKLIVQVGFEPCKICIKNEIFEKR